MGWLVASERKPGLRVVSRWYYSPRLNVLLQKVKPASKKYLDTLCAYYEEEVSGEAYFYGLIPFLGEDEKLGLLARVECRAAASIFPLIKKYGLEPRGTGKLRQEGLAHVNHHKDLSWTEFMRHIVDRYPGYLEEFSALEAMAPKMPAHMVLVVT